MWTTNYKPNWKLDGSIYFRYMPDLGIWGILITFKLLNVINKLLMDRAEVVKLETKCYQALRHEYPGLINNYNNLKHFIFNIIIYIYVGLMIFYLTNI